MSHPADHINDEHLVSLACGGGEDETLSSRTREHIAACSDCQERMDIVENALLVAAEHASELIAPLGQRIELLVQLRNDENFARRLFGTRYQLPLSPRPLITTVRAVPKRWSASIIRRLLGAIEINFAIWDPMDTLAVSELGVEIAEQLQSIPLQVRCRAWREYGIALGQVGRQRDAQHAFETALALAEQIRPDGNGRYVGLVRLAHAELLRHSRPYEALELLSASRMIFDRYDDSSLLRKAREQELAILYALGRYEEALVGFRGMLASSTDEAFEALQLGNIGHCLTRLGSFPEACDHFARAAVLYDRLSMRPQRARMLRSLGRIAIQQTGLDGLAAMMKARSAFEDLKMVGEVVLTILAAAEELASLSTPATALHQLLLDAAELAVASGMDVEAVTALQALRDGAAFTGITAGMVRAAAQSIDGSFMPEPPDAQIGLN